MEKSLLSVGLTKEEISIYLSLLEKSPQSAIDLSKTTPVKRTYVYQISRLLIEKGLITEKKLGRTTVFSPNSPDHLLTLAENRKTQAELAAKGIESLLDNLKNKYASVEERPVITYYEGLEGLKKIYKDIIKEKKDILLFRSIYDDKRSDLDEIISKQIELQIKTGIHVHTITPLEPTTKNTYLHFDKKRLVKRHIIKSNHFSLSSQIIVYANKIAIISLKGQILATLIDNKDVADSHRKIFETLWNLTETEHNQIIKKWL